MPRPMHFEDLEKAWISGTKKNINVETSTTCIVHCAMCARAAIHQPLNSNDRKQFMHELEVTDPLSLIDFHKLCKFFNSINLCGVFSDPIYWKKLPEAMNVMQQYPETRFRISTAAHGPSYDWYMDVFSKCPKNVGWTIGIDGLTGNTSRMYRQKQNTELMLQAYKDGIKKFDLNVCWQFIVFEHNAHELEDAKQEALNHNMGFLEIISDRIDQDGMNRLNVKLGRENKTKDKLKTMYFPKSWSREQIHLF